MRVISKSAITCICNQPTNELHTINSLPLKLWWSHKTFFKFTTNHHKSYKISVYAIVCVMDNMETVQRKQQNFTRLLGTSTTCKVDKPAALIACFFFSSCIGLPITTSGWRGVGTLAFTNCCSIGDADLHETASFPCNANLPHAHLWPNYFKWIQWEVTEL